MEPDARATVMTERGEGDGSDGMTAGPSGQGTHVRSSRPPPERGPTLDDIYRNIMQQKVRHIPAMEANNKKTD